ncbi:MAG: U32 family peptidase [Bacteroidia bacterium]|nr:U32 family peptidase [Bacteroidia bacterium]
MVSIRTLELLAPAKNLICGRAAIAHGADAIYIGGPKFGAREDAGNSLQDIEKLVSEAQIFGVNVYVALNTILYDSELEDARQQIKNLYEIGVDALIIQDMGILEMDLPPIPLHASTQLHNYLPEQIKFLEAVHFKRAVLARELNLEQIRDIRSQTSIELEAFIHGSLCVSFSGRCYLSHAIGGRSANRGACAQPCRKRYTLYDAERKVITADQHLLSLKDLNHSNSIKELAEAGIQSFKIEGRLKEVDYVKNITAFYRKKIDAFLEDQPEFKAASAGKISLNFEANPTKSFNRGATDYFLHGRSKEIVSFESPKFLGEAVGEVTKVSTKYFELETALEIANNDGLVFIAHSGESIGIKVNVAERDRIFPDKMNGIFPGARVYRNYDHLFHQQLKADLTVRKITLNIEIAESDDGFELTALDESGIVVSTEYFIPKNPSRDPQKSKETIIHQLTKSGDTPFFVAGIKTNGTEKFFFQASVLNAMRRDLLDRIMEARKKKSGNQIIHEPNNFPYPSKEIGYEGNISNRLALQFYKRHGVDNPEMAFEKQSEPHGKTVMTTKHCLKFQMGFCPKYGGKKPLNFNEPFYLNDGVNELRLDFDCLQCVMKVVY